MPLSKYNQKKLEQENQRIRRLYKTGEFSCADIARMYNKTRQRVWQVINGKKPSQKRPTKKELFQKNLKEARRQYDDTQCQLCWRKDNFGKPKMDTHHLDGNKKNNDLDNLITICSQCHAEVHTKARRMTKIKNRG